MFITCVNKAIVILKVKNAIVLFYFHFTCPQAQAHNRWPTKQRKAICVSTLKPLVFCAKILAGGGEISLWLKCCTPWCA